MRRSEVATMSRLQAASVAGTQPVVVSVRLDHVSTQQESIESISAVTLLTVDMVEAVAFYQTLGFSLLYGGPEARFTSFRVGTGYLNLQLDAVGSPRRALWGRVVLRVNDVDAMYRRALAAGFQPENSPADAPWGERYFHIRDRDGHELSFARPLARR
jgi:catechol 2,3-dioxygenase-like lactoylglutathione lyase family enzyme